MVMDAPLFVLACLPVRQGVTKIGKSAGYGAGPLVFLDFQAGKTFRDRLYLLINIRLIIIYH